MSEGAGTVPTVTGQRPLVLGIESSCDDTACAVLDGAGRVLASRVASQTAHRAYGGVVPEIASREHLAQWPGLLRETLDPLGLGPADFDAVAATRGPGLVGSLLVGLSLGKALAFALDRPFFGVHHLEGHLYSPFLDPEGGPAAPEPASFAALVVSGGHTALYSVAGGVLETVAETRDDAAGEVFDKLGKRLGLPFPQGPVVDRLAERGRAERFELPVPRGGSEELFFSYSGLKSAALRHLDRLERSGEVGERPDDPTPAVLDLLAGFRVAAVAQLEDRVERLYRRRPFAHLAVSGGVAANRRLRAELARWAEERGVTLWLVPLAFSGDNAAMIAHVALRRLRAGDPGDDPSVEARGRLRLD